MRCVQRFIEGTQYSVSYAKNSARMTASDPESPDVIVWGMFAFAVKVKAAFRSPLLPSFIYTQSPRMFCAHKRLLLSRQVPLTSSADHIERTRSFVDITGSALTRHASHILSICWSHVWQTAFS
jgi:hypothetical protein